MGNITQKELLQLQEDIQKAPESKKKEIMKVLDLYIPLITKQIKRAKKELEA